MSSAAMNPRQITGRKANLGFSMLEVLVAILILSLGLLGMASLQARALKGNHSAMQNSQAVVMSYALFDLIRADRTNASSYALALCNTPSKATLKQWLQALQDNFGGNKTTTCAKLTCQQSGESAVCELTIQWDDSAAGGSDTKTVVTRTRI